MFGSKSRTLTQQSSRFCFHLIVLHICVNFCAMTSYYCTKLTEQNRTEQSRADQGRAEQSRTEQNRTEQNRTEQNNIFVDLIGLQT